MELEFSVIVIVISNPGSISLNLVSLDNLLQYDGLVDKEKIITKHFLKSSGEEFWMYLIQSDTFSTEETFSAICPEISSYKFHSSSFHFKSISLIQNFIFFIVILILIYSQKMLFPFLWEWYKKYQNGMRNRRAVFVTFTDAQRWESMSTPSYRLNNRFWIWKHYCHSQKVVNAKYLLAKKVLLQSKSMF